VPRLAARAREPRAGHGITGTQSAAGTEATASAPPAPPGGPGRAAAAAGGPESESEAAARGLVTGTPAGRRAGPSHSVSTVPGYCRLQRARGRGRRRRSGSGAAGPGRILITGIVTALRLVTQSHGLMSRIHDP
jgi:hypothetical protein